MLAATIRRCLLGGTLAIASACSVPPPTAPSATPASATTSPRPAASARSRLAIADLPVVDPDPASLTAICDPEPIQVHPDAGETAVLCHDAVVLGLRAASTATMGPITRIYVRRPRCAAIPCSSDELNTAMVVAWGFSGAVAFRIDSRLDSTSAAEHLTVDPWPRPSTLPAPEVRREVPDSAPAAVASRSAYPYCGRATFDTPQQVLTCFRDSVLLGLPAEAIKASFGTEGGEVIEIVRFAGRGAISRFQQADGRWVFQHGSLILGVPGGSWAFDPWDAGDVVD